MLNKTRRNIPSPSKSGGNGQDPGDLQQRKGSSTAVEEVSQAQYNSISTLQPRMAYPDFGMNISIFPQVLKLE